MHTTVFEVDGTRLASLRKRMMARCIITTTPCSACLFVASLICGGSWIWASREARIMEESLQRIRIYGEGSWTLSSRGGANLIQMSDSAQAFLQDHRGVRERFNVNHSEKEWTKHVRPIWNVETGDRRACLCSANYADSQWQKKKSIPDGLKSGTAGSRRTMMLYVRPCQWRGIVHREDRWSAFCVATKRWRELRRILWF